MKCAAWLTPARDGTVWVDPEHEPMTLPTPKPGPQSGPDILTRTLDAARRDAQTVTASGQSVRRLTEGVVFKEIPTHIDDRGMVFELFDSRWTWHDQPLVFSYCFTIRPGIAKGWGLHKLHEDRYVLLQGELKLVLYDPRPESKTYGEVCEIVLTEHNRRIVNVPRNVWHADQNIGTKDVVVINFPTICYDHTNPDKYRLPLDTDLIPYKFEGVRGW
jgi:dTDP-4-dehydrorhamnose 3,5-epimerase